MNRKYLHKAQMHLNRAGEILHDRKLEFGGGDNSKKLKKYESQPAADVAGSKTSLGHVQRYIRKAR